MGVQEYTIDFYKGINYGSHLSMANDMNKLYFFPKIVLL